MLTMNTPKQTPTDTRAPISVVQGNSNNSPPSTSAEPMNRSYPGAAPMEYQMTPIGEKSPNGSSSRLRNTVGIWSGNTFANPYENIVVPSATRMNSLNHLWSRGWLVVPRATNDHTTVPSAASRSPVNAWVQSNSVSPLPVGCTVGCTPSTLVPTQSTRGRIGGSSASTGTRNHGLGTMPASICVMRT